MMYNCSRKGNPKSCRGFTLIELLVVISIVSILAGVLYMVINPAQMQRKAREAVLRANTSRLCLALSSCGAAKDSALLCDTEADIGVPVLTALLEPATAVYTLLPSPATNANDTIAITGNYTTGSTTCVYDCNFNFSDANTKALTKGADCL